MEEFLAQRAEVIATAEPGLVAAGELCRITDEAVRELARAASSLLSERWAIVALGGWGAGRLLPASDLDILVLSDAPEASLKPFVEAILYPLWDAGLKVGHQVRSPKQQVRAMRSDLKTCTAALTARVIAGDLEWGERTAEALAKDAGRRRRAVLAALRERPRPGSPYLLEPDLKEDAGGRRDYDELRWTAAVVAGAVGADTSALIDASLLTADDVALADAAAVAVATARWRLHAAGYGDTLTAEAAVELGPLAEAAQAALADTALVLTRLRAALDRGKRAGRAPERPWTPAVLFATLDRGTAALSELELAATAGLLDELIPGMRRLMAVRRPGLGHRLTVGAHCLYCATLIVEPGDDRATVSRAQAADVRLAQLAALVHDAAKLEAGAGHAERGAEGARLAARRAGFDEKRADDVADLVRLHLALVETASREDLDDEDAILRCAARVGRRELVAPLHLLTIADSQATGPATWTPWMATLVNTLVSRLDAALSPDIDGAGVASLGERVRTQALSRIGRSSDGERAFVEAAPLRYLAARAAQEVARDARLVARLSDEASSGRSVLVAVDDGAVDGTFTVTAVAFDRPALLARLAGAIALAGLDILSVDAYGGTGRVALDSFVVRSATGATVTPETLASIEELAENAIHDRLELASRLAERRRHYPPRATSATNVEVAPTGWDTTVVVETPDRPGLLHDLAAAVSASGLDIRWARAQTLSGVARDTFHVAGPDGGPVTDPGVLGHLAMRLRDSV